MKINSIILFVSIFSILLLVGCSVPEGPKACTEEAKICPDGSAVGRTGPNCEFQECPELELEANECSADERGKTDCADTYEPVCGWFNDSIKCIKYPCASNYATACWACSEPQVAYWTQGPCPRTNAEMQDLCRDAGGIWLSESKECEDISEEQCSIMNGEFNECASACRNDPGAEVCTLQCIMVCQFK
ncbi:MAG: hypothetical protein ACP5NW_02225 [Candidatus Woesearchaeota archaeon]